MHDRVVIETYIGSIVEGNTTTFVHGDVVDNHIVEHVHGEGTRHQEAQTTAVIFSHIGLDQVVVDIHWAGTLRSTGLAIARSGRSSQFAGDDDASTFIVGVVIVNAVIVALAIRAVAKVADSAAV